MIRSIADEGHAPKWLKDKKDVPYHEMLFSGFAMLLSLWFGLLFPRVYLFLVSSSGFSLLFTYAVILAIHICFRKMHGCPPRGKCQMPGFPYSSWLTLIGIVAVILSMPFISGQGAGLVAGIVLVALFSLIYAVMKLLGIAGARNAAHRKINIKRYHGRFAAEFSKELAKGGSEKDEQKTEEKRGH